MLSFAEIYQLAVERKGSQQVVHELLPIPLSVSELKNRTDDRYLSDMSFRVFQAGFSWRVVEKKWPAFEKQFFNFNPKRCVFINAEEIEQRMQDESLIRHLSKMKSIPLNALMVDDIAVKHGSFGEWLAKWPEDDVVGLWLYLKKHSSRLGGNSGPMFLRIVGKDTFLLSADVIAALINYKVIDKKPSSVKSLYELQERFNQWQSESGRPYCEISRLLSLTV